MNAIQVNASKCIGCKKCIEVCPTNVFSIKKKISIVEYPEQCIECGQCVAVCPKDAISHDAFPKDSIKVLNDKDLPSPKQLMNLLEYRRSNRTMNKKPISQKKLEQIIHAAYQAPTAENKQLRNISVIQEEKILKQLTEATISTFEKGIKPINNPLVKLVMKRFKPELYEKIVPTVELGRKEFNEGNDMILRGATTVLLFHDEDIHFGDVNSQLAYQNASLMAESLGIAQFYLGYVIVANRQSNGKMLQEISGNTQTVYAAMALGMPKIKFKKRIIRSQLKEKNKKV